MQRYSAFALARRALKYHQGWERAWASPSPRRHYKVIVVGAGGHVPKLPVRVERHVGLAVVDDVVAADDRRRGIEPGDRGRAECPRRRDDGSRMDLDGVAGSDDVAPLRIVLCWMRGMRLSRRAETFVAHCRAHFDAD